MNRKQVLKWYIEMGVDEISEDSPVNYIQEKPSEPFNVNVGSSRTSSDITLSSLSYEVKTQSNFTNPSTDITNEMPVNNNVMVNPMAAALNTKKIAEEVRSLDELRDLVKKFDGMAITKTATNCVFGDGNPDSDIMFIGEAPGADEDIQGIPFCGQSGQLLSQMLTHIGLIREKNYYITNTIFWRPPGNRRPTPEELAICKPFVEKHIALIKPKLIILVGGTAITSVLDSKQGITKMRGQYFDYTNEYLDSPIKLTAIFHPSYLLRSPGQKKLAWQDCLQIDKFIEENKLTR